MDKQLIISVGREYGSGGHFVAEMLAKKYDLPLYDSSMLDHIAEEKGISADKLRKFDEKPKNIFLSRSVAGHSNSPQDIVTQMQFDFLKDKAAAGESFVVVGRCANSVLKEYPALVSVFITSTMESKIKRITSLFSITDKEAEKMITTNNRRRKLFHNYYCKDRWGDSRNYDLTVSTAKIGYNSAADVIDKYISALG